MKGKENEMKRSEGEEVGKKRVKEDQNKLKRIRKVC